MCVLGGGGRRTGVRPRSFVRVHVRVSVRLSVAVFACACARLCLCASAHVQKYATDRKLHLHRNTVLSIDLTLKFIQDLQAYSQRISGKRTDVPTQRWYLEFQAKPGRSLWHWQVMLKRFRCRPSKLRLCGKSHPHCWSFSARHGLPGSRWRRNLLSGTMPMVLRP